MTEIQIILPDAKTGKLPLYNAGDIYGRLTLTGKSYQKQKRTQGQYRYLECLCECGKTHWVDFSSLRTGNTQSCGCFQIDAVTKHGLSSKEFTHPIYKAWQSMKERCYNPDANAYEDYGGRGIIICEEWLNDVNSFYNWSLLNGWEKGLSLDRFPDNNGNYEPTNCRWANRFMQCRNRRSNYILEAFGEKKCISEWVVDSRCVVTQAAIKYRLMVLNWSPEQSISAANNKHKFSGYYDKRN